MKKFNLLFLSLVLLFCLVLSGCGSNETAELPNGLGGKYLTDSAYGMENFTSEIDIETDDMEFDYEVEHFGEEVEEDEGKFTFDGNTVTLIGKSGEKKLVYSPSEKTLYSEEMDTIWTHSSEYIKSAKKEAEKSDDTVTDENSGFFGTYRYSDDAVEAEIVIDANGFSLNALSKTDNDTFTSSGNVKYVSGSLVLTDEEEPVICGYDEAAGTINYDGMIFTKENL